MKKTLLILFVAAISLTACKKDSEDKLEGRWNLTKENYIVTTNDTKTDEGTNIYQLGDFYIVFEENTYKVYDEGDLEDEGTYSANDNSLTMTSKDGDKETASLRWNSKTEFVLTAESTEDFNGISYGSKYEMTFNKH